MDLLRFFTQILPAILLSVAAFETGYSIFANSLPNGLGGSREFKFHNKNCDMHKPKNLWLWPYFEVFNANILKNMIFRR